jgi:hypothetical protein
MAQDPGIGSYLGTGLSVAKSVFDMASTYAKTKQAAQVGQIRANAEGLRAATVSDDLRAAQEELGLSNKALEMADRAAAAQVLENEARFGKLRLDRDMIGLEAEQQENSLRRKVGIAHDSDIAMAVAMGIDPTASMSFVSLAQEQQRQAGEMIQNIRLNRTAADVSNTMEEVTTWGRQAGLISQQGALAQEKAHQARTALGIGAAERNTKYAQFIASATGQGYADMGRNAWIGAAGSFMSSLMGQPAGQELIGAGLTGIEKLYDKASGSLFGSSSAPFAARPIGLDQY